MSDAGVEGSRAEQAGGATLVAAGFAPADVAARIEKFSSAQARAAR